MVGFSTGAVAKGNFHLALSRLSGLEADAVELSCLRDHELIPMRQAFPGLALERYKHVSFHAPSQFRFVDPKWAVKGIIEDILPHLRGGVVVHADQVHQDPLVWSRLGASLLIENNDNRKAFGQTADDLEEALVQLDTAQNEAGICLDIGHAIQVDPSRDLLTEIVQRFGYRIRQIHISSVLESGLHQRISGLERKALTDTLNYLQHWYADHQDQPPAVIIESPTTRLEEELRSVQLAMANNVPDIPGLGDD